MCAAAATALAAVAVEASPGACPADVTGPLGDRDLPDVATGVHGKEELPRLLAVTAAAAWLET